MRLTVDEISYEFEYEPRILAKLPHSVMTADLNDDGYPSVRLTIGGKRTRYAVHVLVARAHLPSRPSPRHEVRHLDGNKLNPRADNLAWGTRKDNADDRERHGRTYHMTTAEARAKAEKSGHVIRARAREAINV